MSNRAHFRIGLHAVIVQDGKLLMIQRQNTSFADGYYWLPGGHHDGAEAYEQGMLREIKEEVGLSVKADDLELVGVAHTDDGLECIQLFFWVHNWQGEPVNGEPDKSSGVFWLEKDNLPDPHRWWQADMVKKVAPGSIVYSNSCFSKGGKKGDS